MFVFNGNTVTEGLEIIHPAQIIIAGEWGVEIVDLEADTKWTIRMVADPMEEFYDEN